MSALLLGHLALAVMVMVAGHRLGRRSFRLIALPPIATLVWCGAQVAAVRDGRFPTESVAWAPELGVVVDLRLDGLGVLMVALVSGVGLLVFEYAFHYFGAETESPGRLAGTLLLFSGSMLGLVLADNVMWVFVCWELTSITSYLLIGHDDRNPTARAAAQQALLITSAGGLTMLGGLVLLGLDRGTFRISELVADPVSGGLVTTAGALVLVGAFAKSAQAPLHGWLPGAMVASTPISAYLHSAAMVKAGVFLVARLGPAFSADEAWRTTTVVVGVVTAFVGGLRAIRQHDLKLLLAFSTVSQLGLLMVLFGVGGEDTLVAGAALLLAHGMFKAALFMVVGVIDHQAHTRDLRRLGGFGRRWRLTMVVAAVSAASMAGIPPLAGFVAKEAALGSLLEADAVSMIALVGFVGASVLTAAYSVRFVWGAFARKSTVEQLGPAVEAGAPHWSIVAPAAVLAVATLSLGLGTAAFSEIVDLAAQAVNPDAHAHLALWHGASAPLMLSIVIVVAGLAVFHERRAVDRLQERLRIPWSVTGAFNAGLRGLSLMADRVTGIAQPGSLPIYAGIILLTAVALPGYAIVAWGRWPGFPELIAEPAHVAVAALIVGGATAALASRRRFAAAVCLGSVGYGMTLLFVVQGAPDLALTQFAIETLTVVLFMLVLRFLPDQFEHRSAALSHRFRVAVSCLVGVFVFVMLIVAAAARSERAVSEEMVARSLPDAGGRNVVNVILVDFRGLDTLGEITVLAVAAVGAVALARVGRHRPSLTPTVLDSPSGVGAAEQSADADTAEAPR